MKRVISVIITVIITVSVFSSCKPRGTVTVLDGNNNVLVTLSSFSEKELKGAGEKVCYLNASLNEAVDRISDTQNCNKSKAQKILLKNNCVISTYFDEDSLNLMTSAFSKHLKEGIEFSGVLTDKDGAVLAICNNSTNKTDNATSLKNPYSTIKPLSVYAPALEDKKINWSSMFLDSEYKKIKDEEGNLKSWPENANGKYLDDYVTVEYALKKSLNTVAVKVLADYGVKNSINFLSSRLNIDVSKELDKSSSYGEEEIIGNIALGYLATGVSVLDMAGYYGIFLNDGNYTAPHFLNKITDSNGNDIYNYEPKKTQVLSGETANIMKNMLKSVVTNDGTGAAAQVEDLEIAGKTGTGNNNDGNWFVGFSPDYCSAIWHGDHTDENVSPEIFSDIFSNIPKVNTRFKSYFGIKQLAYCYQSGKLLSRGCSNMQIGYYTADNIPEKCDVH